MGLAMAAGLVRQGGLWAPSADDGAAPTPPSFVAAGTRASHTAGANITPGVPAGYAEDDIFLCVVMVRFNPIDPPTWPAGWTGQGFITVDGSNHSLGVAWRRATSSESAPTLTRTDFSTNTGEDWSARIVAYRGCTTSGSPIDDIEFGNDTVNDAEFTLPTVTTTVAGCLLVGSASGWDLCPVTPGSWTERWDDDDVYASVGNILADTTASGTGSQTGDTMDALGGGGSASMWTLALKPA